MYSGLQFIVVYNTQRFTIYIVLQKMRNIKIFTFFKSPWHSNFKYAKKILQYFQKLNLYLRKAEKGWGVWIYVKPGGASHAPPPQKKALENMYRA